MASWASWLPDRLDSASKPTRECQGPLFQRMLAGQAEEYRWQVVHHRYCDRARGLGVSAAASAILDGPGVECWRHATLQLESMATSGRIVQHAGICGPDRATVCNKRRGA